MSFTPSANQQAIFDWVKSGTGCGIVNAVAGSGKTTTIVKACEFIPQDKSCVFLAFNKSIAVELGKRVPRHVEAKTLNALGHRAWTSYIGRVALDGQKTRLLCQKFLIGSERRLSGEVAKLVGLAKSFGIAPQSPRKSTFRGLMGNSYKDYLRLVDHFDIDTKSADEGILIELAQMILKESANEERLIDFNDQLWLPIITNIPVRQYDWVIVDEAQDLSPVQRELLRMSLKDDGRLLAVGDPYQAIYGFRGADSESMDVLKAEFDCKEMPLSMSYRCPKSVVRKAQRIVPHIEASPGAPEGRVEYMDTDQYPYTPGDMVICRNSAPIVSLAYELLARQIPVVMMGRDIGEGLIRLIDKMKPKGIEGEHGLLTKLEIWSAKEVAKAIKKGREARAQSIDDKHQSILSFIRGCKATTVPKLKEAIVSLFSGGIENRVVLSTIHKAKGLEAGRVYVYRVDLMPSHWAKQEWQMQQEQNLMYVAYTRSMNELILVRETADNEDDEKNERKEGSAEREEQVPIAENNEEKAAPIVCDGDAVICGPDASGSSESSACERENVA